MLLGQLVAAGIGNRPVVFVTHRFVIRCKNDEQHMNLLGSYIFMIIIPFFFFVKI